MTNKRKKRVRKIKTQNAIKRRRNTRKRNRNFGKNYNVDIEDNLYYEENYNKKPYFGQYTELYEKMGLTVNAKFNPQVQLLKNIKSNITANFFCNYTENH